MIANLQTQLQGYQSPGIVNRGPAATNIGSKITDSPNKWEASLGNQSSQGAAVTQGEGVTRAAEDFGLSQLIGPLGAQTIGNEGTRQNFLIDAIDGTPGYQSEMEQAFNTATSGPEMFGAGRAANARVGTDAIKRVGNAEQGLRIGAAQSLGTTNALRAFTEGAAPFMGQRSTTAEQTGGVTTGQSFDQGIGKIPKGTTVQQSSGGGGGGSVICTLLREYNHISARTYLGCAKFGGQIDPYVYRGYRLWATPLVKAARRLPILRLALALVAIPWATEMAYQVRCGRHGSGFGQLLLATFTPLCYVLGRLTAKPQPAVA